MPYDKEKYFDWSVYIGIITAEDLARTDKCHRTGSNADGFAIKFIADEETKRINVYKLLPSGQYSLIGEGEELKEKLLEKWGGLENFESITQERLYHIWGGRENYDKLFSVYGKQIMRKSDDYVDLCIECGCKMMQERSRCANCMRA